MVKRRHVSKPQSLIVELINQIKPGLKIEEEKHLGDRLRLDIYLPDLGLGIEYHGRQHYNFVQHFHKTPDKFVDMIKRDKQKKKRCKELGINLTVISYKDSINEGVIKKILSLQALKNFDPARQFLDTKKQDSIKKQKEYRQLRYKQNKTYINSSLNEKRKELMKKARRNTYLRYKQFKAELKEKENNAAKENN